MIGDGLDEIRRCAGGNGQIVCHVGGIDGGLLVDIAGVVFSMHTSCIVTDSYGNVIV